MQSGELALLLGCIDSVVRQVVFSTPMFVRLAAELSHHSNRQQKAQTRAPLFLASDKWIAESDSKAWAIRKNKNAVMSEIIPNVDPIGHDYGLTPVMVDVPLVIIDYEDLDCLWYPEVMDKSAADRMAYSIMRSLNAEAFRVDVKIVLPSAADIRAATADLDRLSSEPVRVKLLAN